MRLKFFSLHVATLLHDVQRERHVWEMSNIRNVSLAPTSSLVPSLLFRSGSVATVETLSNPSLLHRHASKLLVIAFQMVHSGFVVVGSPSG